MKFPAFVRILAVAALIGQLGPLPAAVVCSLRHRVPVTSCEGRARTSDPAVGVATTGVPGLCAALPCVASSGAGVPTNPDATIAAPAHAVAMTAPAVLPARFAAAPIPPPPEA